MIDKQIERLKELRAKRDANRVESALNALTRVALSTENIIPHILEAVEAYATVGEISDALRKVWGEYKES